MDATVIDASPRETGSKASRAIRENKNVPCILYGRDTDPVPFQVPVVNVNKILYGQTSPILQVQLNGESWNCILKDYDLHAISDTPVHADFQVLREGRKVTLTVPIRFKGIPEGQKNGGDTQYIVRELTISVLPKNIPSEVEIDVSHLKIGDAIHVYDLDVDYDIQMAAGQTLATVVAPHLEAAATADEEEEEALEEGEEELPEGEEAPEDEGEEAAA